MSILKTNPKLNLIFKSIGLTIITIILVNFIYFLIKLFSTSINNNFNVKFEHGLFIINGESTGLNYSELKYWLFYGLIFIISIFYYSKKQSS